MKDEHTKLAFNDHEFADRNDVPIDPLLYKDPVLLRLAKHDEVVSEKIKAIQKAEALDIASSSLVLGVMRHELGMLARNRLLFPYSEDANFEQVAEENSDLAAALGGFETARSIWHQNPDDEAARSAYLLTAERVENLQESLEIYMQDEF